MHLHLAARRIVDEGHRLRVWRVGLSDWSLYVLRAKVYGLAGGGLGRVGVWGKREARLKPARRRGLIQAHTTS